MKWDQAPKAAAEAVLEFDDGARELFAPVADSAAGAVLHPISKLADQPQLRAISAALIVAGIFARNQRLTRAGSRMIMAHEAATFAKDTIKTDVERTRPRSAGSKRDAKPRKGKRQAKEVTSFPSGHTSGAIAVARAFSREFPEYAAPALGAAAFLALLQVVRDAHYPTDVLAGVAVGLAAEKGTDLLWSAAIGDPLADD